MFVVLDIGDAQQGYPLSVLALTNTKGDARKVFLEACRVADGQGYSILPHNPEAALPWRYPYNRHDARDGRLYHRIEVHKVPCSQPEL